MFFLEYSLMLRSPLSNLTTLETLMLARLASSCCDMWSNWRAARQDAGERGLSGSDTVDHKLRCNGASMISHQIREVFGARDPAYPRKRAC